MNNLGLLTIHDTMNYGSLLQTYSLYKAVQTLGQDVTLIDYKCEAIKKRETPKGLRDCHSLHDIAEYFLYYRFRIEQREKVWEFLRSNCKVSAPFDKNNVAELNQYFDSFLIGSDIVWGMDITGADFTYFLDFALDDKRKLAFSSSVGTKWGQGYESRVKDCLSRFEHISTREREAADWIGELLGLEIPVTCDPTMLWDEAFWKGYADTGVKLKQKKYVLVYRIASDKQCIYDAVQYGKRNGMPVYYINYGRPYLGVKDIRPNTVQDWLSLISNADTVFTNSYHGMLFSLYFKRNLFFYNVINKTRMSSIASLFEIQHREAAQENLRIDKPIDHELVQKRLTQFREYSWERLKSILQAQ